MGVPNGERGRYEDSLVYPVAFAGSEFMETASGDCAASDLLVTVVSAALACLSLSDGLAGCCC